MEKFRDTSRFVGRDIFVNSWYSKHLYAMREPVLFVDHTPNEFFRFTWLRSFHPPIAIRLERREDRQSLFWKSSDGKGGYEPGELVMDKQKTIDLRTWLVFRLRLEQLGFWKLETNQETFGFDGSRWILEGKVACKYHVVDRWSPNGEDPYFQLCDFLIRLTDLQFAGYEKY